MRILVATDLSEAADEAIRQGHARAGADGALALCHVVPHFQPMTLLFPQRTQQTLLDVAGLVPRAEAAVKDRVTALTGRAAAGVEVFVDEGVDYAEIARRAAAWKADLVVVGSHGLTGLSRILLGSVAERVARYAPCPVLVARPGPTDGPVIAGTDLSDPSLPAISTGQAEAARAGVPLVVVHAIDFGGLWPSAATLPFGIVPTIYASEQTTEMVASGKTILQSALASCGADGEAHVVVGSAASAIVREAVDRQARLVVVGTHGRTGLAQLALGSVAEKVVRAAPCSVLVVRLATGTS